MATYAIGDIQGCYDPLCRLLEKIKFDQSTDRLWFAGDLINRGPKSLETLRFVKTFGDAAITVLGNHDIHLLALHYGVRKRKDKDSTLFPILDAPDASDLIDWLQSRPLIHIDNNYVLVHAGIHPHWSLENLQKIKTEVESAVHGARSKKTLGKLYGNTKGTWEDAENSDERVIYALNCLTRMRYCESNASPDYKCSESPGKQPEHLKPWFEFNNSALAGHTILFGHWAALGYHHYKNVYALDSGCVWGNSLTALKLEDKTVFTVSCVK